ncbi:MAG: zinc-dependent metalloprotease [Saprospiraceae bacterium]|nr:zinc-dependent metalloprotease [Saprospiraceae bacterium]
MKKLMVAAILLFCGGMALHAQTNHSRCGNSGGEWQDIITERLLRNKQTLADNPVQFRSTVYVPVRFHLVANTAGQGRVEHWRVLEQLCRLNQDFADMDMQFYIKGMNDNINNNAIYSTQYTAGTVMNLLRDPTALNVWIVDLATPVAPTPGETTIVLGYYNPQRDWVVIRRSEVRANSVTLPHEFGHFFDLAHTHNGWDATPWSPSIGNPAPIISPGGVPTERQNGSNCDTAGDYICDTPPDYNGLGYPTCNYNIAQDPTGVFINPDEKLFMSYFDFCPRDEYYFSPTQVDLMWADYNHSSRNYLRSTFVPNLTEITETPVLTYPVGGAIPPGYNAVNFQWTAVAGADFYLLEIDRAASYTINPLRIIVSGTNNHTVTTLEPNRSYFWRIRPYNAYRTCATFTQSGTFQTNNTIVNTTDITDLNEWSIAPNPVYAQGSIQINLQASRGFEGVFTLYNTAGQVARQYGKQRINTGATSFDFNVEALQPGIYMLTLDHEEGREVRRVVVAR